MIVNAANGLAVTSFMSKRIIQKETLRDPHSRVIVGVSFEAQAIDYLDGLARRMGMSRSWVLNTIVYEYAKLIEKTDITPLVSRLERQSMLQPERSQEVVISA
jgi:hypothetical protein